MDSGQDPEQPMDAEKPEETPAEPSPEDQPDPGEVDPPVYIEDTSSIIEMEVDDSNTGDTITSNPEIDLGSAAAAATAVIIESDNEKSNDACQETPASPPPEVIEDEAPPVIILDDEPEIKVLEKKESSSSDEIMEVDPQEAVVILDSELEQSEAEDKLYTQDEESMTSPPDDNPDKENTDEHDDYEDYLEITQRRISQDREGNCYCGKDRNYNIAELLCASCYRWFHESCISYQLGKLLPFTTNYVFTCKNCSVTGLECFRRNQPQFPQMCITALANLRQQSVKDGTNLKHFSKDKDIIPFFEIHYDALTAPNRRLAQTWHSAISRTLMKESESVFVKTEVPGDEGSPYFGLISDDLSIIRPNYEAMIKSGQLKVTERSSAQGIRGRGAKRGPGTDLTRTSAPGLVKKPRDSVPVGHGYPAEHPFNKDGFRYILAEPDPNAPFRQEFDESNEWSGKPIHGWLCRTYNPPVVLLAMHDRAPALKVSDDRLSVTGDKGYCMIRATHGVSHGRWYFEAKITEMPEGSATRIGWCQHFGNLQGPLGFDRYGYSWRSRYGTAFHEARGKSYVKGGYSQGDILGFMIDLPVTKGVRLVPTSFKDRPLVKVKSHLYYEDKDDKEELKRRDVREGAKIMCFKNGVYQGVAFEDIFCGTYYPAVSLFKGVTVKTNFGPDFWAPPNQEEFEYKGMFEKAELSIIEQTMADMIYLTENDGQLHLDNAVPMPV